MLCASMIIQYNYAIWLYNTERMLHTILQNINLFSHVSFTRYIAQKNSVYRLFSLKILINDFIIINLTMFINVFINNKFINVHK